MSDDTSALAAALSPYKRVVQLLSPIPAETGYLIVNPGLPNEERMKIESVDESGLVVTVWRESPANAHMLASYVTAPAPVKVVRGVQMTPYRVEFERRVKKVIVAHASQYDAREHADHDLQDCTFSTDVMDGTVYSSYSSDSASMTASVSGPCRCGKTVRADAEWPGYDLGKFFQMITDDAT